MLKYVCTLMVVYAIAAGTDLRVFAKTQVQNAIKALDKINQKL